MATLNYAEALLRNQGKKKDIGKENKTLKLLKLQNEKYKKAIQQYQKELTCHLNMLQKLKIENLELVSQNSILKKFAEKSFASSPKAFTIICQLLVDLFNSVIDNLHAPMLEIVPHCLSLIENCPFEDLRY